MNKKRFSFVPQLLALGTMALIWAQATPSFAKEVPPPPSKAAITQQIVKALSNGKVSLTVGITTVVAAPYFFKFPKFSGIKGMRTVRVISASKRIRPSSPKIRKQRFHIIMHSTTACQLKKAVSKLSLRFGCTPRKGCKYMSQKRKYITFTLNTEYFCGSKTVNIKKK